MEVWNNVFTQFDNDGHGNYTELKNKNIDTGMGLERLAVVVQDVDSIFDVDTLQSLRNAVCDAAGKIYHTNDTDDVSIRLITDHIRSATFMISDGIMPSNEGRGYVLRRIIRRAARHGRILGIDHLFLAELAKTVISGSKDGYPELEEKQDFIFRVLENEESQFNKTIDQGLRILSEIEDKMNASGEKVLSGDDAFKLYDTYGFPLDLTKEILEEKGYTIDEEGFRASMKAQQEKARGARKTSNYMGEDATVYDKIDPSVTTEFIGYDKLSSDSKIIVITDENDLRDSLMEGERGTIVTDKTPFYATMGGQEGDTGIISNANGSFKVEKTIKLRGGREGHVGVMTAGMLYADDIVMMSVDKQERRDTCKNHSATHLLQKALKTILGSHVEQKGSLVTPTRLRFDFSHFQAMTAEEIAEVERLVNDAIEEQYEVKTDVMNLEEAKKTGAMALFGEKYGEKVRVVNMGGYSIELCGGTHVSNTSQIGSFKILSEAGIAAGVRRIEALTGRNVIAHYADVEAKLDKSAALLKTSVDEIEARIGKLIDENKALSSENESLKSKLANEAVADVMDSVKDIKGTKLLAAAVPDQDMNGLRGLGDSLKEKLGEGVVVLASSKDGKVSLCAMATDAAVKAGAHAGNIVKQAAAIVGGGGGGRPNMASAGGKDASKIPDAISAIPSILEQMIK